MPAPTRPPLPADIVEHFNALRGGFNSALGLRFIAIDYDEIRAEITVTPALHQPYGLVHGGVYAAMIETLASCGAAINIMAQG
ncbi:MAG: hotdog fold thioesterase, partial [Myxococcales bacterium]|nr:hotdog fold thioesterase [Myxococcales bacterium]